MIDLLIIYILLGSIADFCFDEIVFITYLYLYIYIFFLGSTGEFSSSICSFTEGIVFSF